MVRFKSTSGRAIASLVAAMKLELLLFVALGVAVRSTVARNKEYERLNVPPNTFDARTNWPQCRSIGSVVNQGCCASSHVIAPISVMSDRTCISTSGANPKVFSAQQVLGCCPDCAMKSGKGCIGGNPEAVYKFWVDVGIASGGPSLQGTGCQPYLLSLTCLPLVCSPVCVPGYTKKTVIEDLSKGKQYYKVYPLSIQAEIYNKGPVSATIDLYTDFLRYRSGVYVSTFERPYLGKQHIKLIGWGTEGNQSYWLAVNSYGTTWGDRGMFKILREQNHLGVEGHVFAADA